MKLNNVFKITDLRVSGCIEWKMIIRWEIFIDWNLANKLQVYINIFV
jgi:hypothetical protein